MVRRTTLTALLPLLILLVLSHCSSGTLTLNVDILSFFAEEDRDLEYGENPVIPGNGPSVSVKSPTQSIPIPEEIAQNGTIEEIYILFAVDVQNETGEAQADFRAYACEAGLDPFLTPPILSEALVLAPDSSYTLEMTVGGDERFRQLFTKDEIYFATEIYIRPGQSADNIKGLLVMEELKTTVSFSSTF